MKAQSSYLLLPSISDYTDLLEPYQNRIQTAIDAFFDETQIEVNVISAYRFAQDEPFKIKDIWKESANFSLLITVNLHEDLQPLDWEWGTNIALTNSVDTEEELPFSLLEYAKTEVMLPILQGLPDAEGRIFRSPEKYAEAIIQVLEFIKEKKKTNYFVINGNKYYDGVVAHLAQKDEETVVIQAFKHNGQSFPEDAVWEGVPNQVTGGEASLSINEPSSSAQGQLVKVSYLQGNKLINLAIRVVIIKVTFEASPDQAFGFDKNPKFPVDGDKQFCYPSYETAPPEDGLPWKSIQVGSSDKVIAKIEPNDVQNSLKFDLDDNGSFRQEILESSNSKVILQITASIAPSEGVISVGVGGPNVSISNNLKIVSYHPIVKNIYIVEVYNGVVDEALQVLVPALDVIKKKINKIYNTGAVSLIVKKLPKIENLGFDINNNGIDVPLGGYSSEMNYIFNQCQECSVILEDDENAKFLFLVNNPNHVEYGDDIQGRFSYSYIDRISEKFGFIFPNAHESEQDISFTIAHELGHGLFFLRHPWAEFGSLSGNWPYCGGRYIGNLDISNIMDEIENPTKTLSKYYWDQMH